MVLHIYWGCGKSTTDQTCVNISHKESEILPFMTTWMDLEGITQSEGSQTEKDKYYMISVVRGI